jgi:hypothetical protein
MLLNLQYDKCNHCKLLVEFFTKQTKGGPQKTFEFPHVTLKNVLGYATKPNFQISKKVYIYYKTS